MNSEINLLAFESYLKNEIFPSQLAKLLDELLFEHLYLLFCVQNSDTEERGYNTKHTQNYLYHLKRLRDLLNECEGKIQADTIIR